MPETLYTFLQRDNRRNSFLLLAAMSLFCLSLSLLRCYLSGSRAFVFLNWNLFLAAIPLALSSYILLRPKLRHNGFALAGLVTAWLLFFPNSPYILTDLFHLKAMPGVPKWYDLVLILSYAWTGLIFGFLSLRDMEKLLAERFSRGKVFCITALLLFIVAFGVYLGRYERWNSWDVLSHPLGIFADVSDRILHPAAHANTWGMTIGLGVLLNFMHWSMKVMAERREN